MKNLLTHLAVGAGITLMVLAMLALCGVAREWSALEQATGQYGARPSPVLGH